MFFHSIEKTLWRDTGIQKESFHFQRLGLGMALREVEMEEGYLHMQKNCAENIKWLICSCSYLKLWYIKTKPITCYRVLHAACHLHFIFFGVSGMIVSIPVYLVHAVCHAAAAEAPLHSLLFLIFQCEMMMLDVAQQESGTVLSSLFWSVQGSLLSWCYLQLKGTDNSAKDLAVEILKNCKCWDWIQN